MAKHVTRPFLEPKPHTLLTPLLAIGLSAMLLAAPTRVRAQINPEIIGRVEGVDFTIEAPQGMPAAGGDAAGILASGNRLIVRSGNARVSLKSGGEIIICGAARLQLLKSQNALTIALDYGTLRVRVEGAESVAIFTPLVTATPISIGGGVRETAIGLDQKGQMCLRALSGAARISQQLSGESVLVPQYGGLSLSGGQLNPVAAEAPGCTCELDTSKPFLQRPAATHDATKAPAPLATKSPAQVSPAPAEEKPPAAPKQNAIVAPPVAAPSTGSSDSAGTAPPAAEPIYKVQMPAFTFNASDPGPQPEPSPETMILVRSVHAKEDTIFQGTVEPMGTREASASAVQGTGAETPHSGILARIGGFFRRMFGISSAPGCEGAGCK
jgi:hypothetical protein